MSDDLKKYQTRKQITRLFNIILVIVFLAIIGLTGWYIALTFKDKLDWVEETFKKAWATVQSLLILIMTPITILSGYVKLRSIFLHYTKENKKQQAIINEYKKALNEPTDNELIKKKEQEEEVKQFQIKKRILLKSPEDRKQHNLDICDKVRLIYPADLRGIKYIEFKDIANDFSIAQPERLKQMKKILKQVGINENLNTTALLNRII